VELPIILVNCKTYPQAVGGAAVRFAMICEAVAIKHRVNIAVAPALPDLSAVAQRVEILVFAQHVDPISRAGRHTGYIPAESVKLAGAAGTLINHSEHKLGLADVAKCVKVARDHGLVSVCCAADLREATQIARLGPDLIAYEDPQLIGTGRPISRVKPEGVRDFVKSIARISPHIVPLCGAGITTGEDVRAALDLGTRGVLVASAIVTAPDPRVVLEEMVGALKGKV
jgi:triosephosphate isomerase